MLCAERTTFFLNLHSVDMIQVFESGDAPVQLSSPEQTIRQTRSLGGKSSRSMHWSSEDASSKSGVKHCHSAADARLVCEVDIETVAEIRIRSWA